MSLKKKHTGCQTAQMTPGAVPRELHMNRRWILPGPDFWSLVMRGIWGRHANYSRTRPGMVGFKGSWGLGILGGGLTRLPEFLCGVTPTIPSPPRVEN